jgi:hypothetical protein
MNNLPDYRQTKPDDGDNGLILFFVFGIIIVVAAYLFMAKQMEKNELQRKWNEQHQSTNTLART